MAPASSRNRRTLAQRLLGLGLVVVCAGGPLTTLLHLLLVKHVTCALHGELVHASAHAGTRAASPETTVDGQGTPGTDDVHDHCVVATHPGGAASVVRPAASFTVAPAIAVRVVPARPAPPSLIAVVSFAPKHGPPA